MEKGGLIYANKLDFIYFSLFVSMITEIQYYTHMKYETCTHNVGGRLVVHHHTRECTTAVYHNDATYHNQRNLSQLVTQHVTIDANYHNSNAKCHNAKCHINFDFFCNLSHVFAQNEEYQMEIEKFE